MKKDIERQVFEAKKSGLTDKEIGKRYNVSLRFIERVMTKYLGVNLSSVNATRKKIRTLQPREFTLETTTVWSFKSRGNWATHNGSYRGNWSPYIPRNVILKYSREGDLVMDCFCGAGTTGVECKLTNRNFIGIDVNPKAIELAKENVDFSIYDKMFVEEASSQITFKVGDARNLSFIDNGKIDLICTHPPYANIIHYTDNKEQDISFCDVNEFLEEMSKVAKENYRVLKEGGYCAVLIGDMRRKKHVIPLGFGLIDIYLKNGFFLKELVIKRQHNCKTTGFWYKNSIKYNFLLLAHEYLAIFKKLSSKSNQKRGLRALKHTQFKPLDMSFEYMDIERLETTTVWIFDNENWYEKTMQNLIKRYDGKDYKIINEIANLDKSNTSVFYSLFVVVCIDLKCLQWFYESLDNILGSIKDNGYLAIICNDIRLEDGTIYPMAINIEKYLKSKQELKIKEIVIISIENKENAIDTKNDLTISHKYLLIYRKI